jgi:hypothetical protein
MIIETEFYPPDASTPIIYTLVAVINEPPLNAVFLAMAKARRVAYYRASRLIFTSEEMRFVIEHDQTRQAINYAALVQRAATPADILGQIFGVEVIPERRRHHEQIKTEKKKEAPCSAT